MSPLQRMNAQWWAGEADWKGRRQLAFRLTRLRFEWGRWCYIVHPYEGCGDYSWWEWEDEISP